MFLHRDHGRRSRRRGFTLIELVLTIVIAGLVVAPTTLLVVEALRHTYLPEHYTVGAGLLGGQMNRIAGERFSQVTTSGAVTFDAPFQSYTHAVAVSYVDGTDLNTAVAGPTAYKRVTVTIARNGFPGLSAVTVVTDN